MSDETRSVATVPQELSPAVNLLVQAIINLHGSPAPLDAAERTIAQMRPSLDIMFPALSDDGLYAVIAGEALKSIAVEIDPPVILAPDYEPWFVDAVSAGEIKLERWYSYKQFLTSDKGFAPQVLDALDQASTEVIDLLGDPNQTGSWKRRGLVIGDVQSGKTATYIGIVNKAADAGYKLVVLLTGGTESLRQQTQYRVDEGFLGKDSSVVNHDKVIGVGHHPTRSKFLRGQGMTTHAKDFVTASFTGQAVNIDPNADHPYVFVIKKNTKPLENIIAWLTGQLSGEKLDLPMLVVDDESDYASVNTNYKADGDKNPTAINARIRQLLELTTRSSYMAFTATPFANVFIDHETEDETFKDDLFPHHYIFALSSPSNYFGAKRYFGSSEEQETAHLVEINDGHECFPPRHKSHLAVPELPESLEDAIRAFVVASAIRVHRGDKRPRSMLVNVSRFKNVQGQVFDLVASEFSRMKNAIEIHAQPPTVGPDTHHILVGLRGAFETHFQGCGASWAEIRDKLLGAVIDTTVELINSSRDKKSDDKPRNMIAVGGDVLSRGLTVEGLTVSYFFRMVGAADTLLQMARWFGYRSDYEDLVRVWISPEVADQFRFVSDVSEELRAQIREMRDLGQTPKDFGLMVRKHPESLAITAKKGVAESRSMVISLSGRRIETTRIPAKPSVLRSNQDAVRDFLMAVDGDSGKDGWDRHPSSAFRGKAGVSRHRIADLLERFRYDRGNLILANALHQLIRENTSPAFQDWTVGVVGGDGDALELAPGFTVPSTPKRSVRCATDGQSVTFRVSGTSARLAGSTDLWKSYNTAGEPVMESHSHVYENLPSPTLLIYPLIPILKVKATATNGITERQADEATALATEAWGAATEAGVTALMALKIAIRGKPGGASGDVKFFLNGPAIREFQADYQVDSVDEEDLDD
ncbi:Z1 domain-containing protein [Nocardioides sp.]|uniref:Z1 domain-containing protein n=1 Tax=Nocardioides sp. TaxID=35761 RepID=UPI0035159F90